MTAYRIEVRVMPRASLLDPQGNAVHHALAALGFDGVDAVRVGKALTFTLEAENPEHARREAEAMCTRLLANPVTEDFAVTVEQAA
jgi:phosphoribosylformylglycinamidine synthase